MLVNEKEMLPKKYIELGFALFKFGEKSQILQYHGKTIFAFGINAELPDDVVPKLCDYYLKL
jgi:hypothetical protein